MQNYSRMKSGCLRILIILFSVVTVNCNESFENYEPSVEHHEDEVEDEQFIGQQDIRSDEGQEQVNYNLQDEINVETKNGIKPPCPLKCDEKKGLGCYWGCSQEKTCNHYRNGFYCDEMDCKKDWHCKCAEANQVLHEWTGTCIHFSRCWQWWVWSYGKQCRLHL